MCVGANLPKWTGATHTFQICTVRGTLLTPEPRLRPCQVTRSWLWIRNPQGRDQHPHLAPCPPSSTAEHVHGKDAIGVRFSCGAPCKPAISCYTGICSRRHRITALRCSCKALMGVRFLLAAPCPCHENRPGLLVQPAGLWKFPSLGRLTVLRSVQPNRRLTASSLLGMPGLSMQRRKMATAIAPFAATSSNWRVTLALFVDGPS